MICYRGHQIYRTGFEKTDNQGCREAALNFGRYSLLSVYIHTTNSFSLFSDYNTKQIPQTAKTRRIRRIRFFHTFTFYFFRLRLVQINEVYLKRIICFDMTTFLRLFSKKIIQIVNGQFFSSVIASEHIFIRFKA